MAAARRAGEESSRAAARARAITTEPLAVTGSGLREPASWYFQEGLAENGSVRVQAKRGSRVIGLQFGTVETRQACRCMLERGLLRLRVQWTSEAS